MAYESQLKSDRAELHRRVAAAIESRDPAAAEENAALIAGHLQAGGDLHAAYGWHMRAATWATNRDIAAAVSRNGGIAWLRGPYRVGRGDGRRPPLDQLEPPVSPPDESPAEELLAADGEASGDDEADDDPSVVAGSSAVVPVVETDNFSTRLPTD